MAKKVGRVRCGRWDGRRGARCGRVLRDVAVGVTDRMQPHEITALRGAVQEFSGKWWEVTRPVAAAGDRERDTGRVFTRPGVNWWEATCRCGVAYMVPLAELRAREAEAVAGGADVYLAADDRARDTPDSPH